MEITFDIEAFDFDPDSVSEVPWVIEHNGSMLSDSILANYLELGALGDSLSDWSGLPRLDIHAHRGRMFHRRR